MNWVYMIECQNGSYYTGFSVNLPRRFWLHQNGISGAKYMAAFKVRALACCWKVLGTKGDSLKIEAYIKKMRRGDKEKIVKNPELLEIIAREHYGITIASCPPALVEAEAKTYALKSNKKRRKT
jgi:putative endonuclease